MLLAGGCTTLCLWGCSSHHGWHGRDKEAAAGTWRVEWGYGNCKCLCGRPV